MAKYLKIAGIVIMTAILFFPLICGICGIKTGNELGENRILANLPHLSLKTIGAFPTNFNRYFNDNFPLRTQLVDLYNALCYGAFNDSYNSSVIMGDHKFLFYTQELNGYKKNDQYPDYILKKMADYLTWCKRVTEQSGGHFYFCIGPNKSTIYPEYVPKRIKQNKHESFFDQLMNYLKANTDVETIDFRDALMSHKPEHELYYSNGTHWNSYASWHAYQDLMKKIHGDYPDIYELGNGDLATVPLSPEDYTDPKTASISERSAWVDVSIYQPEALKVKTPANYKMDIYWEDTIEDVHRRTVQTTALNETDKKYKLLVYRDSFFEYKYINVASGIMQYLAQSVPNGIYHSTYYVNAGDIAAQKPNIVILELVERNLYSLFQTAMNTDLTLSKQQLAPFKIGDTVNIGDSKNDIARYFTKGLGRIENGKYCWTAEKEVTLEIPLSETPKKDLNVWLKGWRAYDNNQRVIITSGATALFDSVVNGTFCVKMPRKLIGDDKMIHLNISCPNAVRPRDVGGKGDTRYLSLLITGLSVIYD